MYAIECFLDFEIFVFFLLRWRPRKTRHVAVLGLAYLCFGIARLLLMFWDYSEPWHSDATAGYYITAAFFAFLAMSVFMHAAETFIKRTHHVFTLCFLGLSCVVPFFPPSMYETVQMIYYIFAPVLIIFVIGFLFYLMSMTTGSVRKKFFVVFLGLALYGTGYALSARLFDVSKIVSESVVLVGLAMTALGFIEIPMLEEIHWHDYLLHVFTFHIDTSACIYDEQLYSEPLQAKSGQEGMIAADLFSSGVSGVIGIIKEMINSEKKLKVLDHEDKKILLEYGKYVTVALVTRMDLDVLHEKLRTYILRVETELQQPLESWRGEVGRFAAPMKSITADVLKTVFDKNWWRLDPRSVARQVASFFTDLIPRDVISRITRQRARSIAGGEPAAAREEPAGPVPGAGPAHSQPDDDPWPSPDPARALPQTPPAGAAEAPVDKPSKPVTRARKGQAKPPVKPAQGGRGD